MLPHTAMLPWQCMYQAAYVGCILYYAAVFLSMALKERRNYFFDIQSCSHASLEYAKQWRAYFCL